MTRSFFRNAAAGVIVYDVTNPTSFANTRQWLRDFLVRVGIAGVREQCPAVGCNSGLLPRTCRFLCCTTGTRLPSLLSIAR